MAGLGRGRDAHGGGDGSGEVEIEVLDLLDGVVGVIRGVFFFLLLVIAIIIQNCLVVGTSDIRLR